MKKFLGLDLGTNSIGWSIVDTNFTNIIDMGVVIFKEGVHDLGQGDKEMSKNAARSVKRGTRKQLFRRQLRKKVLLKLLKNYNMCPVNTDFNSIEMREWFKQNPYELRAKALTEQLSMMELGRICYHFAQRRGFQSNSRSATGTSDGKVYEGIKHTESMVGENQTLGAYLYSIAPKDGSPYVGNLPRIRNRYTTRKMYIEEFEKIWDVQQTLNTQLTATLKAQLGARINEPAYQDVKRNGDGVLFFQRPLRSQKHKIGLCSFESNKARCAKSCIDFEEFAAYQFVNTIECNGIKLNKEERKIAVETIFKKDSNFDFKVIKKALKKESESFKFNYKDDDKVKGAKTIASLSKYNFFGKNWNALSRKEQDDIWHAIVSFEDIAFLMQYAQTKWLLSETEAEKLAKLYLVKDYASLSKKAIRNILPFLKKGYLYNVATAMGGVKNALGKQWDELAEEAQDTICTEIEIITSGSNKGTYVEKLKDYLKTHFSIDEKDFSKLYHHSAAIHNTELLDRLPWDAQGNADKEIGKLRNPVVIKAIFQVRKLVNALIEKYGAFEEIKIEMGRDLKATKEQRRKIRWEQKRQENLHLTYSAELEKSGVVPNYKNLLKFKLWKECNGISLYSGNNIALVDLFNDNQYQIEHIHPYSRSLNDSFTNLTICETHINQEKDNRTPYEYFSQLGGWEQVRARALSILHDTKDFPNRYQKFKQFVKEKFDDDFISRQLNDTRYIAVEAKNYLSKICQKVSVAPGAMTARLRHLWGLNALLDKQNDEKNAQKERNDHRHHAIDALVLACFSPKHLNEISRWNSFNRSYEHKHFSLPWESFRLDANTKLNTLLVVYDQNNRIITTRNTTVIKNGKKYKNRSIAARGQLHAETVYGKYENETGEMGYHVRKSIDSITKVKQLEKIADEGMKRQIMRFLSNAGININDPKAEIPKGTFFKEESGVRAPKFFLPNKNGNPVPVFKVRLRESSETAVPLKSNINQYVFPDNNHHILIYEDNKGKLQEKVVTFWQVAEAKRKKRPIFQLPEDGVRLVEIVQKDQLFLLDIDKAAFLRGEYTQAQLSDHLYRVQKITEGVYVFTHHLVAKLDVDKYKFNATNERLALSTRRSKASINGFRVTIDITGKIII